LGWMGGGWMDGEDEQEVVPKNMTLLLFCRLPVLA
jgi:hypothetical protein